MKSNLTKKKCENDIFIEHLMFVKCVEGRAGYKQIPGKVISGAPDTLLVRLYSCTDTHRYTHFDIHRYTLYTL